jgi:hypothetical protein
VARDDTLPLGEVTFPGSGGASPAKITRWENRQVIAG